MKILTIVGARPQFIKAAALSRAFAEASFEIEEVIVHTGQHFDKNMSEVFFEEMEIPKPNYNLNIHGLSHGAMTGQMLEGIETVILKEKPDYVMVYGDTNSTLAGALAAKKLQVKIIHVEAGLRSFNMRMPEEVNRILTDRISDILFCPTQTAVDNLTKEGFVDYNCKVVRTGDVMQDAALYYRQKAADFSQILSELKLEENRFALCTIHRAENTDDLERLSAIVTALNEIHSQMNIVVPLHPRTRAVLLKNNIRTDFIIIEPVGYFDMLQLLTHCNLVLTDSGGLQKEAYFFNKFCVTLRNETEWVELTENGYNELVGANQQNIISAVDRFKSRKFVKHQELYGGGQAAQNMCDYLIEDYQKKE